MFKRNKQQKQTGRRGLQYPEQTGAGIALEVITETMNRPEFGAEQLAELWQQVIGPDGEPPANSPVSRDRISCWAEGIGVLYRRCETYPEHAKIAVILSGIPYRAWHETGWIVAQARNLLKQATPEQLRQALVHEQQHPGGWWTANGDILAEATVEQLTGPVIEQLGWQDWFRIVYATNPGHQHYALDDAKNRRARHIVEHIQQELLEGDKSAWTVFLGIVELGTGIGPAIELANAIEQEHRPCLHKA